MPDHDTDHTAAAARAMGTVARPHPAADPYPHVPWMTRAGTLMAASGPYMHPQSPIDYTIPPWVDQDAADVLNVVHTDHITSVPPRRVVVRRCHKRRFRAEIDAKIALWKAQRSADRNGHAHVEVRHYYCRPCRAYHLTSQPLMGARS